MLCTVACPFLAYYNNILKVNVIKQVITDTVDLSMGRLAQVAETHVLNGNRC